MKDKKKVSEYNRKYYLKNRETLLPKIRKNVQRWQRNNRAKVNQYWIEKRSKEKTTEGKTKNSSANMRCRQKLKKEVLEHMGGKCACCGETEIEFLSMDHVNNDGAKHRRKTGVGMRGGGDIWRYIRDHNYPSSFQILCHNCNWSKYIGNGVCVHKRK